MQKWFSTAQYKQAVRHAIEVARELNGRFDVGLEAFAEYGRPGYRSGFILPRPENRQGFELRCEVLRASDPLPVDTDAIDWVEEARRGVVCDIGQLSDDARRRLKNAARGPRAEIETWRGYWAPVSGASYGMGPLKTCYGPFGAKDALP